MMEKKALRWWDSWSYSLASYGDKIYKMHVKCGPVMNNILQYEPGPHRRHIDCTFFSHKTNLPPGITISMKTSTPYNRGEDEADTVSVFQVCALVGICECVRLGKGEVRLQVELRLLISWPRDRELILDCPGMPSVITRVLLRGRREKYSTTRTRWCWLW